MPSVQLHLREFDIKISRFYPKSQVTGSENMNSFWCYIFSTAPALRGYRVSVSSLSQWFNQIKNDLTTAEKAEHKVRMQD